MFIGLDCGSCRQDFHCGRCACCMPVRELKSRIRRIKMAKGSGITKEMKCSDELQEIVKEKKISRGQMMKAVWKYIKKHDLQGAKNDKGKKDNRWIAPDEKLGAVIGNKPISMFKMAGKLSKHLS